MLEALGAMATIAGIGWALGRFQVLGPGSEQVLARTVFVIATPCLLATTIAGADLHPLLSRSALVIWLSTALVAVVAAVVLAGLWRRPPGEATVGTLSAAYVNAGNLGIPIAVYLLGDAVAVVPSLLFQLLVLAPIAFTVLDTTRATAPSVLRGRRLGRLVVRVLRNPIIVGALSGIVLSALPLSVPDVVLQPFRIVGAAAAPLALLTFGMSLVGLRTARRRPMNVIGSAAGADTPHVVQPPLDPIGSRELVLVVALRSIVHPVLAFAIGRSVGLNGTELLTVVTMAALPTAQNVLVYAVQYDRARALARDAGVVTTLLAVPVMLLVAGLLGG